MAFEYVKEYYGVPACHGMRVEVNGKPGVIIKDCGHHVGVNLDSDKPGVVSRCHPTWEVKYFEVGKIRKPTKAQERYQRYLEYGDCFDSFLHFCYWDSEPEHSWN